MEDVKLPPIQGGEPGLATSVLLMLLTEREVEVVSSLPQRDKHRERARVLIL